MTKAKWLSNDFYAEVLDGRTSGIAAAPCYYYRVRALNEKGAKTKLMARSGWLFNSKQHDGYWRFTSKCGAVIINVYPWDTKYEVFNPEMVV